jgi:hypothetical protein
MDRISLSHSGHRGRQSSASATSQAAHTCSHGRHGTFSPRPIVTRTRAESALDAAFDAFSTAYTVPVHKEYQDDLRRKGNILNP